MSAQTRHGTARLSRQRLGRVQVAASVAMTIKARELRAPGDR